MHTHPYDHRLNRRLTAEDVPSRGIDTAWEKVGEWKARQPEARRQAGILQSACDKLVACAELGGVAAITQDEAILLVQAVAQLKKVWTA